MSKKNTKTRKITKWTILALNLWILGIGLIIGGTVIDPVSKLCILLGVLLVFLSGCTWIIIASLNKIFKNKN